jgi:hypothetical protein
MANPGGSNASRGLNDTISVDQSQICICKCSPNHTPAAVSNATEAKLQCVCAASILQQLIYFHQQFHEQLQPWFWPHNGDGTFVAQLRAFSKLQVVTLWGRRLRKKAWVSKSSTILIHHYNEFPFLFHLLHLYLDNIILKHNAC